MNLSYSDMRNLAELARTGVGIVALGESTVQGWVDAGKLHKIGDLPYQQKYFLGIKKTF
jgi:hypothetical protein